MFRAYAPMSEADWLSCEDAVWMMDTVWELFYSPRKSQLFVCACGRLVWDLLRDERSRRAIEVAERCVDGLASQAELARAFREARQAARAAEESDRYSPHFWASTVAALAATPSEYRAQDWKAPNALRFLRPSRPDLPARLLRDVFGNPFRPARPAPSWLAHGGGAVVKLARVLYDERRFGDLPILADALEDAGCDDEDVLAHCRGGGEHVRGCWVVDLVAGKG